MKTITILFITFISLISITPLQIFGYYCACCAEHGEYSISVKKPDNYEIGELKRLRIAETNLYTDAGYPDNIKGISQLAENYSSILVWQNAGLKFDFKNDQKSSGILNLLQSPTMVDFRTDNHENETGEAVLYKELRFKYKVQSGTGIFSKGITPLTDYFLVLQGKGNNCMNAEDFTHWRLEITGKKANYAFYGKLKIAE